MPLRVAFVSHHSHLRMGGQRSMALLIEHLDRRRLEPLVICPGPGELADRLEAIDCRVVHIPLYHVKPRTLRRIWASSRRIRAVLRDRAIDIIAPDAARDALTCGLAKLGTATKMVWFVRLTAKYPLDPLLERLADGLIGVSNDTRRRFRPCRRVAAKYRTILDGADLRLFRPPADRRALRRRLALPVDRPVLIFVGQVKETKGVLDIVDAMAALRREAENAEMPLLLVIGTPSPPEIVGQIGQRAADGGVAGDVQVLPQQRDIHEWMQAADLLISGSHEDTEGLSRVLYEAMACGTVPVATDIRGNRDALTAATGVLVPERTPLEMARAIRFLLDDPIRRARMGAAGIARARDLFDIQRHARQVEEFYADVVERASTRVVGGPRGD